MIIDVHTHAFPRTLVEQRGQLCATEPTFAELYAAPHAQMAQPNEVLAVMDEASVTHAVIAGFAWRDPDLCRHHNDALLEAVAASSGRLVAFAAVPLTDPDTAVREMERCALAGVRGFGELRVDHAGDVARADETLAAVWGAAARLGLPLLVHASEPVGHAYPGKGGGTLATLWRMLTTFPDTTVILAHLGGGLPFYAHMPEVRAVFNRCYVDTAAVRYLYRRTAVRAVIDLIGADRILFGSDFPLRDPYLDLRWLARTPLADAEWAQITGGNAAALLGFAS